MIGAGPAGSMAALECARAGLRTLLLEKRSPARKKLCGGAVSQRGVEAMDFHIPPGIIERECFALHTRYRGRGCLVRQPERMAILVSRDRFDEFLTHQAAEAGADVRYEQPARELSVQADGVRIATPTGELRCKAAVIAAGVNSRLAEHVRPPWSRRRLAACVGMDIPADAATIDRVCGDALVIDYGITPSGYLWLFPKRDCISAGLGQVGGDGRVMKQTFLAYLRSHALQAEGKLRGGIVPLKAATDRIVGERLLLAGDAGGFVDAFTGEGIHFAMLSGRLAGQTLVAAADEGDFSAETLDVYRRRCEESFLGELHASRRLTNAMYRFPRLLLRTALRHEDVVRKYISCLDQPHGYRTFSRWFALRLPKLWLT
ncbi:MAG: NAD(P)/FAD-dependent oxidoreductase [Phycisphaerae bacterium]